MVNPAVPAVLPAKVVATWVPTIPPVLVTLRDGLGATPTAVLINNDAGDDA